MDSKKDLLNEREAAQWLGISVGTMRRRRLHRQQPTWVKIGARVLYRHQDLESFINANVIHVPGPTRGGAK